MTLKAKIETLIAEKSLLTHPFYQAWTRGQLTQEQLKNYAVQYFQNVLAFPTYVSAVHFNTPTPAGSVRMRQDILDNLIAEEHGEKNHPQLWRNFATALGATHTELETAEMLDETKSLINTFRSVCIGSPFYAGLAALYAYESQIPEIAIVKIDGLKKFYGLTNPDAYEFFTVHAKADAYHAQTEMTLIEQYADTPAKEAEVLAVVEACTAALWKFMDGVYENYCKDLTVCMN
jgi:pyrroloquinoline-quinone synthase